MDITQLILDDHHEQRRLFAVIEQIDSTDSASLAAIWHRLSAFLEVHAKAEEEVFYPALLKAGVAAAVKKAVEDETLDAIKDHNEIRDAVIAASAEDVGTTSWYEAVAKANKANGDHMAEEEREGLTDFRRHSSLEERHNLAVRFAVFEAQHVSGVTPENKDPNEYVNEEEAI